MPSISPCLQFCKAEVTDRVAVIGSILPIDHRVMTVNPHRPIIMRYRESKDLAVELLLAPHKSEKFNNTSHCHSHAMRILSICNIKGRSAAFDLACQEWEVHVVGGHIIRLLCEVNKGLKLFTL